MSSLVVRFQTRAEVGGALLGHVVGWTRPDTAEPRPGLPAVQNLVDHGWWERALAQRAAGTAVPQCPALAAGRRALADAIMPARGRRPAPVIDLLLAGPPPIDAPEAWPAERVRAWADAALGAVREGLGPRSAIFAAALHLDERSPHIHIQAVPIDTHGRLGWSHVRGEWAGLEATPAGTRRSKAEAATAASRILDRVHAVAGAPFGLERGEAGRGRRHRAVDRLQGVRDRANDVARTAAVREAEAAKADEAARERAAEAAAEEQAVRERVEAKRTWAAQGLRRARRRRDRMRVRVRSSRARAVEVLGRARRLRTRMRVDQRDAEERRGKAINAAQRAAKRQKDSTAAAEVAERQQTAAETAAAAAAQREQDARAEVEAAEKKVGEFSSKFLVLEWEYQDRRTQLQRAHEADKAAGERELAELRADAQKAREERDAAVTGQAAAEQAWEIARDARVLEEQRAEAEARRARRMEERYEALLVAQRATAEARWPEGAPAPHTFMRVAYKSVAHEASRLLADVDEIPGWDLVGTPGWNLRAMLEAAERGHPFDVRQALARHGSAGQVVAVEARGPDRGPARGPDRGVER